MEEVPMTLFEKLNSINVNDKAEQKNGLTYLSWAWAWAELKKACPEANYTIYENADGWNYHTDGKTCWVKTGVTADGIEHIEYLPVMDFRNKSIPLENVTSFDVNKAIQRSLTKAVARHGLGLYIYAGEDLPEEVFEEQMKYTDADIKRANLKKLLAKTNSDVVLFLEWCSREFKRPIKAVDEMDEGELDRAIAQVKRKEKKK